MCLYSSFEQRTIETAFIWQNGSSGLKDWLCFWPLTHFQSENINDFTRERTGNAEWSVIAARCNFLPIDSCHIFTRQVKTLRFSARIFFFFCQMNRKDTELLVLFFLIDAPTGASHSGTAQINMYLQMRTSLMRLSDLSSLGHQVKCRENDSVL